MSRLSLASRFRPVLALATVVALGATAGRAGAQGVYRNGAGRNNSGASLEQLRAACTTAATSAGYSVIGRSQETRSGNAYSAILQLRGNGRTADYTCTTDARGVTTIPGITDTRSNGGYNNGGYNNGGYNNGNNTNGNNSNGNNSNGNYPNGSNRNNNRGNRAAVDVNSQRERARALCTQRVAALGQGYQGSQLDEPQRRSDGQWEIPFRSTTANNGRGRGNGNGRAVTRTCRYNPNGDRANIY